MPLIIVCGLALCGIMQKLKLPPLLGMLITGIALGPYALNLIAPEILAISTDLRQIVLVIILLRAGLALDISALKKIGRPAVLMCFVPASIEIIATTIFAPLLFGISYLEAAVMGTILGAVSPAVIVPRMLKLIESGHGMDKNIPQLLMAGSSADDVFVIVLFASFMGAYETNGFDFLSLAKIPLSILTGLALGVFAGLGLVLFFKKIKPRATVKAMILLAVAIFFVFLENAVNRYFPLSGLLGVMALGCTVLKFNGGPLILTVAVLSILVMAPLGAFGIDLTYKRLLSKPLICPQTDGGPISQISGLPVRFVKRRFSWQVLPYIIRIFIVEAIGITFSYRRGN